MEQREYPGKNWLTRDKVQISRLVRNLGSCFFSKYKRSVHTRERHLKSSNKTKSKFEETRQSSEAAIGNQAQGSLATLLSFCLR